MPEHTTRLLTGAAAAGIALSLLPIPAAVAQTHADWGRVSAPDTRLREACTDYPYRYRIDPPTNDWSVEVFVHDPRGRRIYWDQLVEESEGQRGVHRFRLCGYNAPAGRYSLRAKVTVRDGDNETRTGWLRTTHFRLTRDR